MHAMPSLSLSSAVAGVLGRRDVAELPFAALTSRMICRSPEFGERVTREHQDRHEPDRKHCQIRLLSMSSSSFLGETWAGSGPYDDGVRDAG